MVAIEAEGKAWARWGLSILLLLMAWDGAIRKWVLPQYEQEVFVLKDVLLLVLALVGLEMSKGRERGRMPAAPKSFLTLYALLVCMEILNPNTPNALVSIWGIKSHLLPATLVLIVPVAFSSSSAMHDWMAKWYGALTIPVCMLAFFQLTVGPNHPLNAVVRGGMESIALFGNEGLVRVSGSFSYVSGLAGFVLTMFLAGTALLLTGRRSKTLLIGLAAVAAALPSTGSRLVAVGAAVGVAGMLFVSVYARLIAPLAALRVGSAATLMGLVSLRLQGAAWNALGERAATAGDDTSGRFVDSFAGGLGMLDVTPIFGFGSGTANFGAVAFARDVAPFSWLPAGLGFESESGRIMLELGMAGWLLSILLRVAMLGWALRLLSPKCLPSTRRTSVITIMPLAIGLWSGTGVFAVPFTALGYWFSVAALALAQRDELRARHQSVLHDPRLASHERLQVA